MGWLELLPLLKRLVPLLTRMAPMLEGMVVARATSGKDAEAALERAATGVRDELAAGAATAAKHQEAVAAAMAQHTAQLRSLDGDVQELRLAARKAEVRMAALEAGLGTVRNLAVAAVLLLIACVGLLTAVFLRHG